MSNVIGNGSITKPMDLLAFSRSDVIDSHPENVLRSIVE